MILELPSVVDALHDLEALEVRARQHLVEVEVQHDQAERRRGEHEPASDPALVAQVPQRDEREHGRDGEDRLLEREGDVPGQARRRHERAAEQGRRRAPAFPDEIDDRQQGRRQRHVGEHVARVEEEVPRHHDEQRGGAAGQRPEQARPEAIRQQHHDDRHEQRQDRVDVRALARVEGAVEEAERHRQPHARVVDHRDVRGAEGADGPVERALAVEDLVVDRGVQRDERHRLQERHRQRRPEHQPPRLALALGLRFL